MERVFDYWPLFLYVGVIFAQAFIYAYLFQYNPAGLIEIFDSFVALKNTAASFVADVNLTLKNMFSLFGAQL